MAKIEKLIIEYKSLKTAPHITEYIKPTLIDEASGKISEGITKLKQIQEEINKLELEKETETKKYRDKISEIEKPLNEKIETKEKSLDSFIKLIFENLSQIKGNTVEYNNEEYWASLIRQVEKVQELKVEQLVKLTEEEDPVMAEKLNAIIKRTKSARTTKITENYLYQFPKK